MGTYEKELSVEGWDLDRRYLVIEADRKREGLYKASEIQVKGSVTKRFSHAYGKINQDYLLGQIREGREVA